jgi:hypothetical protein
MEIIKALSFLQIVDNYPGARKNHTPTYGTTNIETMGFYVSMYRNHCVNRCLHKIIKDGHNRVL